LAVEYKRQAEKEASMQKEYAVVRAIGTDRVGIVEDLSTLIQQTSCNIEESSMAVLGGEFAVMVLVSGAPEAVADLRAYDYGASQVRDLQVDVIPTQLPETLKKGVAYEIETVSLDSPGIVHAVTALLSREGINIEQLDTDTVPAPFTGAPMFTMNIRVVLEGPRFAFQLKQKLEQLAAQRDLDITFSSLAEPR
jgi:glycine cleavage system transcriptional repressor